MFVETLPREDEILALTLSGLDRRFGECCVEAAVGIIKANREHFSSEQPSVQAEIARRTLIEKHLDKKEEDWEDPYTALPVRRQRPLDTAS